MENYKRKTYVVVGRFQVPELTEGHKGIVTELLWRSDCGDVVIFVGDTKTGHIGERDPFTYRFRKDMIESEWAGDSMAGYLKVFRIQDVGNLPLWVDSLDRSIHELRKTGKIDPGNEVVLCGSRDSFIQGYRECSGRYKTEELPEIGTGISGTRCRQEAVEKVESQDHWGPEFREGVLWAIAKIKEQGGL